MVSTNKQGLPHARLKIKRQHRTHTHTHSARCRPCSTAVHAATLVLSSALNPTRQEKFQAQQQTGVRGEGGGAGNAAVQPPCNWCVCVCVDMLAKHRREQSARLSQCGVCWCVYVGLQQQQQHMRAQQLRSCVTQPQKQQQNPAAAQAAQVITSSDLNRLGCTVLQLQALPSTLTIGRSVK